MRKNTLYLSLLYTLTSSIPLLAEDAALTATPADRSMAVIESQMSEEDVRESPAGEAQSSMAEENMAAAMDDPLPSQKQRPKTPAPSDDDQDDEDKDDDSQEDDIEDSDYDDDDNGY